MGIAAEIKRIKNAKASLKSAINSRGGSLTTELIDDYAAAVTALPTGEGADLSFVTVTAADMREGVVAADADGQQIVGTMPDAAVITAMAKIYVTAGYLAENLEFADAAAITENLANVTAASTDVLEFKQFVDAEGKVVYGSITDWGAHTGNGITVDGNTVTVLSGYRAENCTVTVPETTVDLSFVTATASDILEGKIGADVDGNQVVGTLVPSTTVSMDFYKCAAVYGPYEVKTVVISGCPIEAVNGTYMQTENTTTDYDGNSYPVYKHESSEYYYYYDDGWMFWVLGTDYAGNMLYRGDVGDDFGDYDGNTVDGMAGAYGTVTLDEDVPRTWDGYKAVLTDGIYSFEETVTTGLTYDILTPAVDGIYSADVTVEVKKLYDGTDPRIICYFTMDDTGTVAVDKINGITLKATGTVSNGVTGVKGTCWEATAVGAYLSGTQDVFELPTQLTLNAFMKYTSISTNTYVNAPIVDFGSWDSNTGFGLWLGKAGTVTGHIGSQSGFNYGSVVLNPNVWYMVTMTYDGSHLKTYINGVMDTDVGHSSAVKNATLIAMFSRGPGGGSTSEAWAGSLDEVSLWNSALTAEEVAELYNSMTTA